MEPTSFYWYDYETFGVRPRYDRPAQFAGIRTGLDLVPQPGSRDVWYAKPSEDYLPSPESCLLTGITPQLCEEQGMRESEFALNIWHRLNEPGTVSIGYNTLGFDEEVSRFLFWRNFLDPYAHSWANGCSRWDLFPLTCAVWALRGTGIEWPLWEKLDPQRFPQAAVRQGVCFKLECLTEANGISHSHAHDAMSDVEATIGLARLIREKEPRLWEWAFRNRTKASILRAIEGGRPVVWVSPRLGAACGYTQIAACIHQDKNDLYLWDLQFDPEELRTSSLEDLALRFLSSPRNLPEGTQPLPIRKVKANASPFICASLKVLSPDRAERYGIDVAQALRNASKIPEILPLVSGLMRDLTEARSTSQEDAPALDPDFSLYAGGFPTDADRARMRQVRDAAPQQLAALNLKFDDPRYGSLLFRYRARNWPETLSKSEQDLWREHCRRRILRGEEPAMLSIERYFDAIDEAQMSGQYDSEESQLMLETLYAWGERVGEACSED